MSEGASKKIRNGLYNCADLFLIKNDTNTSLLHDTNTSLLHDTNTSLLHDTFFAQVQNETSYWTLGDTVAVNVPEDINGRRDALVENWAKQGHAAIQITAKTTSRLVTGMGLPHPKENGFAWMRPYGIPYIPGSSVKGMLLGWLKSGWAEKEFDCCKLWGTQDAMGEVIFLDALPTGDEKKQITLDIDVMTPHYGDYYSANESELDKYPPADWHEPIPIKFLTVAEGQIFRFDILAPLTLEKQCEDLKVEMKDAFEIFGIGAKTSSGYGRFKVQTMKIVLPPKSPADELILWISQQNFANSVSRNRWDELRSKINSLTDPKQKYKVEQYLQKEGIKIPKPKKKRNNNKK